MFKLFLESYPFWWESMVVLILSGITLGFLGVWATLKRVIYLPMVFSQISALGVVVGFWCHDHLKWHLDPLFFALVATLLAAGYFSGHRGDASKGEVTGYLIASSGVLLLGNFIRSDLHDINSILFGHAVLVERIHLWLIGGGMVVILLLYLRFYKTFLTISFDREGAAAVGIPVYRYNLLIFFSFGVMIALTARGIGGLPVFGLMIFPGLTALNLANSMRGAFMIAMITGIVMAILGYFIGFVKELPIGSSVVMVGGLIYIISLLIRRR